MGRIQSVVGFTGFSGQVDVSEGNFLMARGKPKLLVVDDEPGMAESITDLAEEIGFEAVGTDNPGTFKDLYGPEFDVVILDLVMPGLDGIELIRFLSGKGCRASIVLISGFDNHVLNSAAELARAQGLQVLGSLSKPLRLKALEDLLHVRAESRAVAKYPTSVGFTEEELRNAIEEKELKVFYQPKVSLTSGAAIGAEALARWEHPERGYIPPGLFIPLAEETGLVDSLTEFVLDRALAEAGPWLREEIIEEIAINLSTRMLKDLDLPERIVSLLKGERLPVSTLVLEITETALAEELVKSLDVVTRLRMKGIRLAIDDFGTGYSTMQQLQRFPFTELKIDRSFVKNVEADEESRAIVETTIDLGRRLGMQTVAEGVETLAVMEYLSKQGCNLAQGYYIARPMPAGDLTEWLQSYGAHSRQ